MKLILIVGTITKKQCRTVTKLQQIRRQKNYLCNALNQANFFMRIPAFISILVSFIDLSESITLTSTYIIFVKYCSPTYMLWGLFILINTVLIYIFIQVASFRGWPGLGE